MNTNKLNLHLITLFALFTSVVCNYEVPEAKIELLQPKGFSVSIPDEEGIELFAFHGKLNEEMIGREGGYFSRDITKAKNGRWTFIDKETKLKPNDVLYYWTLVQYNNGKNSLYYMNDDNMWIVPENTGSTVYTPVRTSHTDQPTSPKSECELSETIVKGARVCRGQLLFEDDFNSIDDSKWEVANKFATKPNFEFVLYTNHHENIKANRGILTIRPTLLENRHNQINELDLGSTCTGEKGTTQCYRKAVSFHIIPPVISAQLNTKNTFSFQYGKVEIRAKLPTGSWIYPELTLEPKDEVYGDNYQSGSMRVAFNYGNAQYSKELNGGLVLGPRDTAKFYYLATHIGETDWSNDFHNYVLEWRPDRVIMSVDNLVYANIKPPSNGFASLKDQIAQPSAEKWANGTNLAPFDKEFFLVLGLGVGGYNFPDNIPDKPWDNASPKAMYNFKTNKDEWYSTWSVKDAVLEIDHVKVWAL